MKDERPKFIYVKELSLIPRKFYFGIPTNFVSSFPVWFNGVLHTLRCRNSVEREIYRSKDEAPPKAFDC